MKTPPDKSPSQVEPAQPVLWYVPDRRLTTKAAAADAIKVFQWIESSNNSEHNPTDQELFAAMHTCAYRALRNARSKRISKAERAQWVERWRTIREHIVAQNLGLAYAMMARFNSKHLDEDDLLSDALLGMTRAVDRFDPWKGYRFSTYACNVISRALMRRGRRELVRRRFFPVQFDVAFERPEDAPNSQTDLYVERLIRVLDENLGELTDLESMIVARRFPPASKARLTFQQIGDMVGLSKERVRQIQNIAIRKLRDALDADPLLQ